MSAPHVQAPSADRLRAFFARRPRGCDCLALSVENPNGTVGALLGQWTGDEIEKGLLAESGSPDIAIDAFEAAHDYAISAEVKCKFLARWLMRERPMKVHTFNVTPEHAAPSTPQTADMLTELFEQNRFLHKQLSSALPTITANYEKTLSMLTTQLEAMHKREMEADRDPAPQVEPPEAIAARSEREVQSARALQTLNEHVLPDLIQIGMTKLYEALGQSHAPSNVTPIRTATPTPTVPDASKGGPA